jgi:hypothetical protein
MGLDTVRSDNLRKSQSISSMTFGALRALHAIIGEAIDDIQEVYGSRNSSVGNASQASLPRFFL